MAAPFKTTRLPILAALIALLVWPAAPAAAQVTDGVATAPGDSSVIEEEFLEEDPRVILEEAEALFNSADQASSIPLLGEVISAFEMRATTAEPTAEDLDLWVRSLFLRSEAEFNLGERQAAEADMLAILRLDPGFTADRSRVSPKLVEFLDRLRNAHVGRLQLVVEPIDARITIGEKAMSAEAGAIPLLAGPQDVAIERPGYGSQHLAVEVLPGETASQEVNLERNSAVVWVATRPPGVAVAAGGRQIGVTAEAPLDSFEASQGLSELLAVDGLLPGQQVLELHREGFRATRFQIDIVELTDYRVDPVDLEPTRGTLVLSGFPDGARLLIGDEVRRAPRSADGSVEIELPPGDHRVQVAGGTLGVFEQRVTLEDRQRLEVAIDLRPSLALVGVLGRDAAAVDDLTAKLRTTFGGLERWTLLDRTEEGYPMLEAARIDSTTVRDLRDSALAESSRAGWLVLRDTLDQSVGASVYVLAALADDLFATHAVLTFWPAGPWPAVPTVRRIALREPADLAAVASAVDRPLVLSRAWLGATLIDSQMSDGALVATVVAEGPAAAAGLAVGDSIQAIAGTTVTGGADSAARLLAAGPGGRVALDAIVGGQQQALDAALGESPMMISVSDPSLMNPTSAALLSSEGGTAGSAAPEWLLELNRAALLMRFGEWTEAVTVLRGIDAPRGAGLGQAAVEYWLAISLLEVDPARYRETARGLFAAAAEEAGARLGHHDGPMVAPRAKARLAALSPASTP